MKQYYSYQLIYSHTSEAGPYSLAGMGLLAFFKSGNCHQEIEPQPNPSVSTWQHNFRKPCGKDWYFTFLYRVFPLLLGFQKNQTIINISMVQSWYFCCSEVVHSLWHGFLPTLICKKHISSWVSLDDFLFLNWGEGLKSWMLM